MIVYISKGPHKLTCVNTGIGQPFSNPISVPAKAFQNLGLRGVHSAQKVFQYDAMKIKILPALSDNYMYLVSL